MRRICRAKQRWGVVSALAATMAAPTMSTLMMATLTMVSLAPAARAQAPTTPGALAWRVARGGDDARAALREAIRESGLGVREPGGRVVVAPADPAQGIYFDPLDVVAMERGIDREITIPLGALGSALAKGAPELARPTFAQDVIGALRESARSDVPTRRFFAEFVLALGEWRQRGDAVLPADSLQLDMVQLAFITRRLQTDIALKLPDGIDGLRRTGERPASARPADRAREEAERWAGPRAPGPSAVAMPLPLATAPRAECTLTDTESTVLDYAATGFGVLFNQVVGVMDNAGMQAAGKYARLAGAANIIGSYVRVALMLTFLEVDFDLEGRDILQRTRSTTTPGAKRTLTAKLRLDVDDLQLVNCARLALNSLGLDFSFPNGGPVEGAEVDFSVMQGNSNIVTDRWGHFDYYDYGYVELAGKSLGVPTDASGAARVTVQGKKQRQPVAAGAEPFERPANVQARVRLTSNDLVKDAPGLAGAAMSAGLTTLATLIPELISRSAIPFRSKSFVVQDWASGVHIKLVSDARVWGSNAAEDPETCGWVARDGEDEIEAFIPVKDGRFLRSTNAARFTRMPICSQLPVPARGRDPITKWDPEECAMRLSGSQQLSVRLEFTRDEELGEIYELKWARLPGAQASVTGGCLDTRYGKEFSPEDEYAGISRSDARLSYMGLPDERGEDPVGPGADLEAGAFQIPAPQANALGDEPITVQIPGWKVEIRLVGATR